MFIVCPSTLFNSKALETRSVPKRMIGRIAIIPRRGANWRVVLRLIFEVQVLRYLIALLPCVIAMLVWPHLALPISQAPIPMLFLIYFVETRVFNIPPGKRDDLVSDTERDRTLDALRFNARRVLTRIAARKDLQDGEIHLVVEQSEMGRVPVLTLVSVQQATPKPQVLDLDPADRQVIRSGLFDDTLSEAALHKVCLRERRNLRSIMLDAREITAHARMAALMEGKGPDLSTEQVAS
jgi:hypothetical protein